MTCSKDVTNATPSPLVSSSEPWVMEVMVSIVASNDFFRELTVQLSKALSSGCLRPDLWRGPVIKVASYLDQRPSRRAVAETRQGA